MTARVLLAGSASALALAACGGPNGSVAEVREDVPALREGAQVAVAITPGKPSAPTETVGVAWASGAAVLTVERRNADGQATRAEARLTPDEFRELWRVVEAQGLLNFAPEPRGGDVFDFGARALTLVAGGDTPPLSLEWTDPLANDAGFQALSIHLGRLARDKASAVQLHYFPSDPSE